MIESLGQKGGANKGDQIVDIMKYVNMGVHLQIYMTVTGTGFQKPRDNHCQDLCVVNIISLDNTMHAASLYLFSTRIDVCVRNINMTST